MVFISFSANTRLYISSQAMPKMLTLLYRTDSRKYLRYEIFMVFADDSSAAKIYHVEIHYLASFSVENWIRYRPPAKFICENPDQ